MDKHNKMRMSWFNSHIICLTWFSNASPASKDSIGIKWLVIFGTQVATIQAHYQGAEANYKNQKPKWSILVTKRKQKSQLDVEHRTKNLNILHWSGKFQTHK